jgi:hypothetical protein
MPRTALETKSFQYSERRRGSTTAVGQDAISIMTSRTSVGSDIGRGTEPFPAGAVSIDISATAGLIVGGTVSAVGVPYVEGVFHRGLHSSVFICIGPTITTI